VTLDISNRGCLVINAAGITNGPLETNDLVEFNERKEFRIKGRIDKIINTGGIKVSPEDIETRISGLIHQPFFISSRPHPSLDRELVLVVEQQPDNATNLLENIKKKLPPHHAPKTIIIKNPIPRTETGKIKRNAEL
jgi:O-succinylbenzoic acid--CoA ligase